MVSKRLNNILSYKIAYRCCDVHIRCDLKLDIGITVAQSFKAKQDIKNLFMTYCIMFLALVPGARDVLITLVMRGAVVGTVVGGGWSTEEPAQSTRGQCRHQNRSTILTQFYQPILTKQVVQLYNCHV